jgi:hypothetical protein
VCVRVLCVRTRAWAATAALGLSFPVSSSDPTAALEAYRCLVSFSAKVRELQGHGGGSFGGNLMDPLPGRRHSRPGVAANATARVAGAGAAAAARERAMMAYDPAGFVPSNDLGPRVYESSTLTYMMFGFKGPLWMHQTCNEGSVRPPLHASLQPLCTHVIPVHSPSSGGSRPTIVQLWDLCGRVGWDWP